MSERRAVTQAEFARLRGVSRKAVTGWKSRGYLILTDDGLVDVDASAALLDARPDRYRGGVTGGDGEVTGNDAASTPAAVTSAPATAAEPDESPLDQSIEEIAAHSKWTTAEAIRVKETYLALTRRQEFEVDQKKLVAIEEVGRQVEEQYSLVRDRLLAIPGKLSVYLVGKKRLEIEEKLRSELIEVLGELSGVRL